MFSAVIESLIKKYCGKFLKKFSSENISIGVTGTLKLTNIEFQTEELGRFQLPYKPIRAFAGEIIADLPFVLGGNFDISVKNMIIVFEKEEHSDAALDPSLVNAILQSLISVFYFAYQNPDLAHAKSLSGADLENTQRLFDRFVITLENIHFRLEERFESLLPELEGSSEHMCTGLLFDRIELRPVKPAEKAAHPELYVSSTSKNSLIVDKMIKCTKMSIYCKREDPMCNKAHSEMLTLSQVLNCHYHRESGNILEPLSFDFSFSAGFQKATQVFGPIIVDFKTESIDFSVTDQQIFYLHRVARTVVDHMYRIQSNAWMSFARSSEVMDRRRMARMRWDMVRKSIKVDWYKYTDKLSSGAMKWRSWFEVWRLAARYVALREILMYHVGYESFTDADTGFVSYAIRENLIMNYSQHIGTSSDKSEAFVGKGNISEPVLKAAESLIYTQIISNNQYFSLIHSAQSSGKPLVINPFELSTVAIRALYALQLELDSVLPFRVSAYCRILAEEKYKIRQAERKPQLYPEAVIEGEAASTSSKVKYTLLVSVIEATQMKASFGSSAVNAYVSLQAAEGWHSGGPLTLTETKSCKASSVSSNAYCLWGHVSSMSVNPALCQHLGVADPAYREADHDGGVSTSITVEAFDRGMFSICYGSANLVTNAILAAAVPDASNPSTSEYVGEVVTHNLKLARQAGLFDGAGGAVAAEKEGDITSVRLLTMVVVGNDSVQQTALSKFQANVKQVLEDRKTVLERLQKLEVNESFNNAQASNADDEDDVFILDPSVLTVQDIQVQLHCPRVTFQVFGVYVVPPALREGTAAGDDLPHDAHLPLIKTTFTDMAVTCTASNNPWIVKGYGSMEQMTVQLMQNDPNASESSTELPPPLMSLPRVTGSFALTQISTMGRNIDGKLDMSCFDFNCTASMYPFTVTVNPQSLFSSAVTKGRNIWRSVRALDHLWLKEAKWAKGTASSSASVDGKPPKKLHPEAMIRLGDMYEAYPKHLNVVTELWCNAIYGAVPASGSGTPELLRRQQTRVKCVAPTRSMDIDINMQPFSKSILPAPLEEIIEANKEASVHLKAYEPPTLFNWFGATTTVAATPAAGTQEAWEHEKKDLLKKIADLEDKNKKLMAEKLSRHL